MCRTPPTTTVPTPQAGVLSHETIDLDTYVKCSTHELPVENVCLESGCLEDPKTLPVLLRKEVIQPHLPVRLPCYDLVLITDPTFDGSLHKGWATGFGCYRLS